jgi:hypothetical protein
VLSEPDEPSSARVDDDAAADALTEIRRVLDPSYAGLLMARRVLTGESTDRRESRDPEDLAVTIWVRTDTEKIEGLGCQSETLSRRTPALS